MFQNAAISQFFNLHAASGQPDRDLINHQIRLLNAMAVTAGQGLAGAGAVTTDIVGQHTMRDTVLPVTRFQFSNGSHVTICDRGAGHNCIVAIRSNTDITGDVASMIEDIAYSTTQAVHPDSMPGMPDGRHAPYAHNKRVFTFMTDEHTKLGQFMAKFAMLQRQEKSIAAEPQAPQAQALVSVPQVSGP